MAYNGTDEFSVDSDLAEFEKNISDLLASGETAFSTFHTAARVEILDIIKNSEHRGYFWDFGTANAYDFTVILDKTQLKRASCFFVLNGIFGREALSGNNLELYLSKRRLYARRFWNEIRGLNLEIDTDDDGVANEVLNFSGITIQRG